MKPEAIKQILSRLPHLLDTMDGLISIAVESDFRYAYESRQELVAMRQLLEKLED